MVVPAAWDTEVISYQPEEGTGVKTVVKVAGAEVMPFMVTDMLCMTRTSATKLPAEANITPVTGPLPESTTSCWDAQCTPPVASAFPDAVKASKFPSHPNCWKLVGVP